MEKMQAESIADLVKMAERCLGERAGSATPSSASSVIRFAANDLDRARPSISTPPILKKKKKKKKKKKNFTLLVCLRRLFARSC